ncbi:serine/threonine-protein kinase [Actinomadura keratinilytica]|uniref:serine/threonine-protein kinase n=1 Tax=Actinomadura keratinilytica TaxID=547461 RepID=UPI003618DF86
MTGAPAGTEIAGRYRLVERLGRGGMGEVWRAVDLRLNRAVAIKLLVREPHGAGGGDRAAARFRREAKIAAGLQHEGIAVHYDAGWDDGRPYLVMELLDGRDLGAVMREHPHGLPLPTVRDLGAQVAEALGAAHERGVVHRDVKPANIMVLPGDRVKILDFGIARYADRTSELTGSAVVGTPAFMAPEQFEQGARPDARTDLYALGAVLFVMLTGRPPFAADTVGALVKKIVLDPPPRVRELRPEIPEDLDGLVAALLAKNPADRPPDVGPVVAVLRGRSAWRAVRPAEATVRLDRAAARPPAPDRRRPRYARRLVAAAAGTVAAASVIAGILQVRAAVHDGEFDRARGATA